MLVTTGGYCRVRNHDFINYDGPGHVSENPNIQNGITIQPIK